MEEQHSQRRLPVSKLGFGYGHEKAQPGLDADLLSFLSGACIALWHLSQFRNSLVTVQVCSLLP